MGLLLDLPTELETELSAEAAQLGLPLSVYVLRILTEARNLSPSPRTSVNCSPWRGKAEALIGSRPVLGCAETCTRSLREQTQQRLR